MILPQRRLLPFFAAFCLLISNLAFASAYNATPKLVVVIVVDQFRGDYLERYRGQFGPGGFRLFLDRGAFFADCHYDYANTRTAPGHATLFTGAYSNGHGIPGNEWWDPAQGKRISSVEDANTTTVGAAQTEAGASPHNLLADTLGDELKLATQGKSRVYGIALKDRSSILPAGFAGNAAFWIEKNSGAFETSTYYMSQAPKWLQNFNTGDRAAKYWEREWKDSTGKVLRVTRRGKAVNGAPLAFYDVVGATPFANDYELEFARELIAQEKLGKGPATDLLAISISATDILGHQVGPDSPEMAAMVLRLDQQLSDFFQFLDRQVGLSNVWMALSADHGVAPVPRQANQWHIPAADFDQKSVSATLNASISKKLNRPVTEYVKNMLYPYVYLSEADFTAAGLDEAVAEKMVGHEMEQQPMFRGYYTRTQLAAGEVSPDEFGRKYAHSYTTRGGWYVMGITSPFYVPTPLEVDHLAAYSYDTHVPLAFFGSAFAPGTYRTHSEPVDMAATLASLLGINRPTHSIGRVLTEALAGQGGTRRTGGTAAGARSRQ